MAVPDSKPLTGQVALITGGATGMGFAFSHGLLSKKVGRVVIASRRNAKSIYTISE